MPDSGQKTARIQPAPRIEESAEELYEHAACAFLSFAPGGQLVKANQTALDWLGYESAELIPAKSFRDLLSPGGRIFCDTHFMPLLLLNGKVREVALDFVRKDGSLLPTLVSGIQKRDAAGTPVINRLTLFDATERRSYERELMAGRKVAEQMAAQLSEANAQLKMSLDALIAVNDRQARFAYTASHDLQAPLRTMGIFAQLLARDYAPSLDARGQQFVANIAENSIRMSRLVRDLLDFAGNAEEKAKELTPLETPLAFALNNLSAMLEETGAAVTHDPLPSLTIDASGISQVFQNLIENSVKYRRPDRPARIHVSASLLTEKEWQIVVEDNGMGFEPQYAERIFGAFKRLHGHDIPGSGIGLATCKQIVEFHRGRIWAETQPAVGSRFIWTLPEL